MKIKRYSPLDVDKALLESFEDTAKQLNKYVANPNSDFTRPRKLPLGRIVGLVITMGGKQLRDEIRQCTNRAFRRFFVKSVKKDIIYHLENLEDCLKSNDSEGELLKCASNFPVSNLPPTVSAFTQQRKKLSYTFLRDMFHKFNSSMMEYMPNRTYNDYHLLGLDGSDSRFPFNPMETDYIINADGSAPYCSHHVDCLYDVRTHIYLDASTGGKSKSDEKAVGIELIERCPLEKVILMADRGYESYNFLAHLVERGWKFIVRAKDVESNGIVANLNLPDTPTFDIDVELTLTNKQTNEIKKLAEMYPNTVRIVSGKRFDYFPNTCKKGDAICVYKMKLRIVRIEVEKGKYEILITNLERDQYPPSELKYLYHLRWNIELGFRDVKYTLEILKVHSRKISNIKQEIYGKLIFNNYVRLITNYVEDNMIDNSTKKYPYQANFVAAVGTVRRYCNAEIDLIESLAQIKQDINPVRDGRQCERNIRPKRPPMMNYRGAGS